MSKNGATMNAYKCIFQGFWPYFPKGCTSKEVFCQTVTFVEDLSFAVPAFCIPCELETPNIACRFFNTFICLHPTVTNVVIYWRIPVRLMMLHCIGMCILLSSDYGVSSFRSIFTLYINKSYNNTVRYWCHLKKLDTLVRIINST